MKVRATIAATMCLLPLVALAQTAPDYELILQMAVRDERQAGTAMDQVARVWKNGYAGMIIDMVRFMKPPARSSEPEVSARPLDHGDDDDTPARVGGPALPGGPVDPSTVIRQRLIRFLERQTGQRFGDDLTRWRQWIWKLPADFHPDYPAFKGAVYANVDPRMTAFFPPGAQYRIRLDEVDWGGVTVNGIPPLVYPKTIPAAEASYLREDNVVFGVFVNGEARAYPKRILAWHEMARDRVGGVELTVVYCTLCGTVLPYESVAGGKLRVLGTSGLLYRSNKLMFDEETGSLWSTLEGRPVIGPLAGSDIELNLRSSVTTTWREWKALHPGTSVLSQDTGHRRDYGEGVAYQDYFSTDRIMFEVPGRDSRLKNKAEVVVLHPDPDGNPKALAISADFLKKNPVFPVKRGGRNLVIVTTRDGANRIYDAGSNTLTRWIDAKTLTDATGRRWTLTEDALTAGDTASDRMTRIAANRAFWFGWAAQFPDTELIK